LREVKLEEPAARLAKLIFLTREQQRRIAFVDDLDAVLVMTGGELIGPETRLQHSSADVIGRHPILGRLPVGDNADADLRAAAVRELRRQVNGHRGL
jgi:hypothetical protein